MSRKCTLVYAISCRSDIVCSDDGRYEELIRSHNLRMQSTSRNFRMQILRQLISHPYNVYEESEGGTFVTDEKMIQRSSKLTVLDNLLSVLIPHHHRVLVFVQFLEVALVFLFYLDSSSFGRLLLFSWVPYLCDTRCNKPGRSG